MTISDYLKRDLSLFLARLWAFIKVLGGLTRLTIGLGVIAALIVFTPWFVWIPVAVFVIYLIEGP